MLDCDFLPLITFKEITLGRDFFLASMDKRKTYQQPITFSVFILWGQYLSTVLPNCQWILGAQEPQKKHVINNILIKLYRNWKNLVKHLLPTFLYLLTQVAYMLL